MPSFQHPLAVVLQQDPRYRLEAYDFVRDALGFAQDCLRMGVEAEVPWSEEDLPEAEERVERHLSGQQLCEAIRQYAIDEFGLMAKPVLNSWGIRETGDFGEIVYNLIAVGLMKKSEQDRREDFDDVYDFEEAFCRQFQITIPE